MPDGTNLSTAQSKWVEDLTGDLVKEADASRARTQVRSDGVDLVESKLNSTREKIREGQTYNIQKMPKNAVTALASKMGLFSKIKSLDPNADPIKEMDSWHDLPGSKGMSSEEVKQVLESMKLVIDIQEEMKGLTDDDGNHVYQPDPTRQKIEDDHAAEMAKANKIADPDEREHACDKLMLDYQAAQTAHDEALPDCERRLAEDLWQPLMREGIIPENAIPDQYSEVSRTFAAASDMYQERLVDYSKSLTTSKEILNKLKPVCHVAEGLLKSASAFTVMGAAAEAASEGVSAISKSAAAAETAQAAELLDLVVLCVSSVRIGAEKAIEKRDAYGVVDTFNGALNGILSAAVGEEMAGLVCGIVTASARGAKVGTHLAKGEFDQALEALGDSIATGMSMSGDESVQAAGAHIDTAFKSLAKIAKSAKSGDPQQILTEVLNQLGNVARDQGKLVAEELQAGIVKKIDTDESISKDEREARIKYFVALTSPEGVSDIAEGLLSAASIKSVEEMAAKAIDLNELKKLEDTASEETLKEVTDFLLSADDAFEEMLINGFSAADSDEEQAVQDQESQLNDIEQIIALQKRNKKIFELAQKVVTGGLGFIGTLVPGVGIAAVATQLMYSFLEAAQHAKQLVIWSQNTADARKSKSVQFDAMLNRKGLEISQNIQADIKVALIAASLCGKCMEMAAASGVGGPVGAVGTAISAAAQGTQGLMDVAVTIKTEVEMAKAWKVYKKALSEPRDRKNIRKALRQNPTLAKYAIAYGAVVDKNPVAIKAMGRCGINEKTLANPNTGTAQIVEYLEMIYAEDPILLRAVPVKREWFPGTPELTLISWNKFYMMAIKKAKPKISSKQDVSGINIAIADLQKALSVGGDMLKDTYVINDKADPALVLDIAREAKALVLALSRYSPTDDKGVAHEEMYEYKDSLSAMAEISQGKALAVVVEIETLKQAA